MAAGGSIDDPEPRLLLDAGATKGETTTVGEVTMSRGGGKSPDHSVLCPPVPSRASHGLKPGRSQWSMTPWK